MAMSLEMEFSKKQQNRHYGWARGYLLLCGIALVVLFVTFAIFGIISNDIAGSVLFIIAIATGVTMTVVGVWRSFDVFCFGKKQKQFFSEEGQLEIVIEKSIGLLTDPFYNAVLTYSIKQISKIEVTRTHIIIIGRVVRKEYFPIKGSYKDQLYQVWIIRIITEAVKKRECYPRAERSLSSKKMVDKAYIPRNFTNENAIIKMDIEKYNEAMRNIAGKNK